VRPNRGPVPIRGEEVIGHSQDEVTVPCGRQLMSGQRRTALKAPELPCPEFVRVELIPPVVMRVTVVTCCGLRRAPSVDHAIISQ
jgi:hypothetical protein